MTDRTKELEPPGEETPVEAAGASGQPPPSDQGRSEPKRRSPLRLGLQLLSIVLVGGLIALLAVRVIDRNAATGIDAALERGETPEAPAFTLPRLDQSGELSLASLRGKAVVLNFWASWCVPCREEAPRLVAAWNAWRDKDVVIVGIDAQDFRSDARAFMRRYGINYPIVHDADSSTLGRYGVTGFPETFFVNRQGKLVGEHVQGPVTVEQLERNIRRALG